MIAVLFVFCESFKMMTMKKFSESDTRKEFSSIGFSAGVVIAQSVVIFVALNFFDSYEMEAGYAIFSGLILLVTGVMYTVLSYASEKALILGSKGAAYALSSVYYIFWIGVIVCVSSTTLMYIVSSLIFVIAFVLSAVFLKNSGKILKKTENFTFSVLYSFQRYIFVLLKYVKLKFQSFNFHRLEFNVFPDIVFKSDVG